MRLKPEQCQAIADVFYQFAKKEDLKVYLYGSRADDGLKGGDIDLLAPVSASEPTEASRIYATLDNNKYKILNLIKKSPSIGDRKIDLKITNSAELQSDPFLRSIAATLVEITPSN